MTKADKIVGVIRLRRFPMLWATMLLSCGGSVDTPPPAAPAADGGVDATSIDTAAPSDGRDVTPPRFGGCIDVLTHTATSYTVMWDDAVDDVTPTSLITYRVYVTTTRGGERFDAPSVQFVGARQGEVPVAPPVCHETSYFVCRAVDAAGNEDTNTIEVNPSESAVGWPPCFDGLSDVGAITSSTVELKWVQALDARSTTDKIKYSIYAGPTSGAEDFKSPLAVTPAGVSSYLVTGLLAHTPICFVVRARDEALTEDLNVVERCVTTL